MKRITAAALTAALSVPSGGCAWLLSVQERLGLAGAGDERFSAPREPRPSYFPAYILDAFPDARQVKVDPASPRLLLASESVLTRDDPHLRRGPPRFSPDGRLLAYEEADAGGALRRIVIRRLDGVEVRSVPRTREKGRLLAPRPAMGRVSPDWPPNPVAWAPASDAFAYTRQTELGAWEVMTADLAAEPVRVAGPPAIDGSIAWSPGGDRIAYVPATRPEEIWVADTREKRARPLFCAGAPVSSFAFAGDGRAITYAAGEPSSDVWVLPLDPSGDPGEPVRITRWAFDDRAPSFSPDGRWVAFYSSFVPPGAVATGPRHDRWSVLVVRADGRDAPSGTLLMERVQATGVSVGSQMPPAWSPDGRWVATVQPRTEDYHAIVLVDAVRHDRHELSPDSLTNEDVAVSADGVLAYRTLREWGDHIVIGLTARGAMRSER